MREKMCSLIIRKLKLIIPLATILMVIVTAVTLLAMSSPASLFAFVVESGDCGLVVEASKEPVDTGNLNPGDTKSSYLMASNTKLAPLEYFFDIEKTDSSAGVYPDLEGKHLDEILEFTLWRDGELLFQGLLSQFQELEMGMLTGLSSQRIDISVHFPEEAANEYQGSSVTVRFMFRSECSGDTDDETGSITIRKEMEFDLPDSMPQDQKDAIMEEALHETFWINVRGPGGFDETYPVTADDDPLLLLPLMEYGDYEVTEVEPMPPLYVRLGIQNDQFTLGKENRDVVVTVRNQVRVEDYEDPGTGTVLIRKRVLSGTDEDKAVVFTVKVTGEGGFEERVELAERDGWIALELDEGTYQFQEIDIPEGYKLLRISPSSITVTEDSEHQITVTNYTGELPPTGGLSLLGLGALLLGARLLYKRRRK